MFDLILEGKLNLMVRDREDAATCTGKYVFFLRLYIYDIYVCVNVRKLLSHVQLCQAPMSMGSSKAGILEQEALSSSGDLPNTGIEPRSPALQADSLL